MLFRLFLVIPASILASLVTAGWTIASFFIWLVVLVAGRVPGPLYDATTALLRYSMRLNSYTWLVTSAYPWGLFGDRPPPTPTPTLTPASTGPAETGPAETFGGVGPVAVSEEASLDATPPAAPTEQLQPPEAPRGTLVLSRAAKRLLVLFIVLGASYWVAGGVVAIIAGNTTTSAEALAALTTAHDALDSQTRHYQEQVNACRSAADTLSCVQSADRQLADAVEAFASQVAAIDFPTEAEDKAAEVERIAHDLSAALHKLAAASSPAEFTRSAADVNRIGSSFDQQCEALVQVLTG